MEDENMEEVKEKEKKFLTAADISDLIGCSESYAYSVIRKLNDELQEQKYIIFRGKINAKYIYKRAWLADD